MSKQESYAVLAELEETCFPVLLPVAAKKTGTTHTLTMTLSTDRKAVTISDTSLGMKNGDTVIWNFVNLRLGDVVEVRIAKTWVVLSTPGRISGTDQVSVDLLEDEGLKQRKASYTVLLNSTDLNPTTQLVIDNMGGM